MKKTWWKLDHLLYQKLKELNLSDQKFLVALSGGADSLALAQSFFKVCGSSVHVAHFHHGVSSPYRDQAQEFCRAWARERRISFHTGVAKKILISEAEMRKARYEYLKKTAEEQGLDVIVTGHQAQDVLETRLMRLIRGTGPQGLKAIQLYRPPFFRPFLNVSRHDIEVYLNKEGLMPLVDPSNSDPRYFRNWLRHVWLPQLEKCKKGSLESLARSLESMVESQENTLTDDSKDMILRSHFLVRTQEQQVRWLAAALLAMGQKNFTQAHLLEVRRRILHSPRQSRFKVAGCVWQINAEQIQILPLGEV